jgi:hypothetical protein
VVATAARAVHPPAQEGQSRKSAALDLARKGLWVIPLCWPDEQGKCACPKNHQGHDVGKAPLTPKGVNDSSNSVKTIWEWWDRWPQANIGIDADKSGLVVIAPDSSEAHQRFLKLGLPETAVAQSGGGEGHLHYFYRRPENTPLININKPDDYDIQPRGYMVGAGSLHQSGRLYTWVTNYQWRDVEDLPYAPEWALAEIQQKWDTHSAAPEIDVDFNEVELRPGLVKGALAEWWNGDRAAPHEDGSTDRSLTLFIIGKLLANQGATVEEIISGLRDRDEALGFFKYSQRKDGGVKEYSAIAQAVSIPASDLSWEEIEAAVRANPVVIDDDQQWEAAAEQQPFGGAGAGRRRFISPADHGAINKLRNRLNSIWMKTHHADQKMRDGAARCGHLPRHDCADCGTKSSDANNHRWNCRARLHPICMGTQMRKPLWKMESELEAVAAEHGLALSEMYLGPFDVGDDPFEWAPQIKSIDQQAHSWVRRLVERPDCPKSIKTSFIGFGYDLYQGWLNLRLVILGPAGVDDTEYLIKHFGEATERPVEIKKVRCRDVKDAIDTFGNLQSSAVIYSDELECRALMVGLKGSRLVQGRGRFRARKQTDAPEDSANVSNKVPPSGILETNAEPPRRAGGKPPPKCPECGSAKVKFNGYSPGDWHKVRSATTGLWYWRLEDADPPGGPGEGFEDFQKDVAQAREERLAADVEVF